jgi:thiamine biosynthesis lipoprotein
MGTEVAVMLDPRDELVLRGRVNELVSEIFKREDRRFSRFRDDSELTAVNRSAGSWIEVSSVFLELTRRALSWAERSEGLFDPTVLGSMVQHGYDRDFDELIAGARDVLSPPLACGQWREVELRADAVRTPPGVGLDFGGIAKGWTVDRSAEAALDAGVRWAVVNAGGDLRILGDAPPMEVLVEDPEDPGGVEIARLRLDGGAIASSSVVKRSWGPGLHHLIDPRTGFPANSGILQATVWSATCEEAEVKAKITLLDGPLTLSRIPGLLITGDGEVITNFELERAA